MLCDYWECLKWSYVRELHYENRTAKVWATLCYQLCKVWRIRYRGLWKVTEGLWRHSLSRVQVFRWCKSFLEGREQVENESRVGRSLTSEPEDNMDRVRYLVRSDRWLTLIMISSEPSLNRFTVHQILAWDFGMRKRCMSHGSFHHQFLADRSIPVVP
jgi:hypothetical protein